MLRALYKIWLLVATLLRGGKIHTAQQEHELAQRALIHLMNQKTDAMLCDLSETIGRERQKLGVVVRNPAMTECIEADEGLGVGSLEEEKWNVHDRIFSMARKGVAVSNISRKLHLSEDEVAMILRLHAA